VSKRSGVQIAPGYGQYSPQEKDRYEVKQHLVKINISYGTLKDSFGYLSKKDHIKKVMAQCEIKKESQPLYPGLSKLLPYYSWQSQSLERQTNTCSTN